MVFVCSPCACAVIYSDSKEEVEERLEMERWWCTTV